MNCEEIRELLPAYVLGALDADEIEAVEEHLRAGREHDDELVELRATVFALDRFGDEADLAASFNSIPRRGWAASLVSRANRLPLWQTAAAAVVLLAVFGAGWLASALVGNDGSQNVSILVQGPEGKYVALAGAGSDQSVTVTMDGFAKLPEGQAYQVWAIRDGKWLRIGVCNTNADGWWKGDFAFTIRPGEQIALTIEPPEGSPAPTSEPILLSSS